MNRGALDCRFPACRKQVQVHEVLRRVSVVDYCHAVSEFKSLASGNGLIRISDLEDFVSVFAVNLIVPVFHPYVIDFGVALIRNFEVRKVDSFYAGLRYVYINSVLLLIKIDFDCFAHLVAVVFRNHNINIECLRRVCESGRGAHYHQSQRKYQYRYFLRKSIQKIRI